MSYGFRFEDVSEVRHPLVVKAEWGEHSTLVEWPIDNPNLYLGRFTLNGDGDEIRLNELHTKVLYVEKGKLRVSEEILWSENEDKQIQTGEILKPSAGGKCDISSDERSEIYAFYFPGSPEIKVHDSGRTSDVRNKYWGKIETIFSGDYVGKRMEIIPGVIGSMEYHLEKTEAYYLQSGRLAVVLRTGRAEEMPVIMNAGDSFVIPRGLMHRRVGLEDCVLFEVSTRDSDGDSHLVEDGQRYLDNNRCEGANYLEQIGLDKYFREQ
tara:strand:+ start:2157 stop:2954 length:798 start_codon:yes stop_codon:yes gene_type:complete